ncbi:MAG: 50S ribosomal protein L11 methyltransferase [Kiritimatiellia bacterium]|jgi:ribosomal protein L11 methyltransferase|nr:50S ribosomal protein L11 methyltransferase [Kiritimatiellia bacterium]
MYVVRIETDLGFGRMLEAWLELSGADMVAWHGLDSDTAVFEKFFPAGEDASSAAEILEEQIKDWSGSKDVWSLKVAFMADKDWQESWKEHFHAEQVSDHIMVKPSWESVCVPSEVQVVDIDPGMSFGTGRHATTRSCLRFIDELCSRFDVASFCDVGCGSGILTVAAAKLGCTDLAAFDNDPVAVEVARRTFERNEVEGVSLTLEELPTLKTPGPFDIVVTNMLSHLLVTHATAVAGLLGERADSRLVLSGALDTQYDGVKAAYSALGLTEESRLQDGEWVTGCFMHLQTYP